MSRHSDFQLRKPNIVKRLEERGHRSLTWACIDPTCDEVTVMTPVTGGNGPTFEDVRDFFGEYIPCASCGGICRRFVNDPSEVEGMPGGAA